MFRKFKSGYFHNNNIKYNRYEFTKTKMIKMELDEYEKLTKVSSKNIYSCSVSNRTKKMLNHRDNNYKITDDDFDDDY
jgi:arsenate reductase-like glutaredoxin family protein